MPLHSPVTELECCVICQWIRCNIFDSGIVIQFLDIINYSVFLSETMFQRRDSVSVPGKCLLSWSQSIELVPISGLALINWAQQTRLLPEDKDRIQSPKHILNSKKTGPWIMSKNFISVCQWMLVRLKLNIAAIGMYHLLLFSLESFVSSCPASKCEG
jgi:hypothetical protein